MSEVPISGRPGDKAAATGVGDSNAGKSAELILRNDSGPEVAAKKPSASAATSAAVPSLDDAPLAQAMIKCPKCGSNVRDVARFCRRCHATMRYTCPSCGHDQRQGGTCEKCGINFIKYIGAVVTVKKAEADMVHERLERRADLLKHILSIPLTGGLSLIKLLFKHAHRD
jgi:predicted RNA-binding Zn-ribbon protein involved in translation (DUF1610 family)